MAPSTKPGQLSSTLTSNSSSTSGKAGATAEGGNQAAHQKTHQPQAGPHVSHPVLRPTGAQGPKDATFTVEDDTLAGFAEQLLSGCWCVTMPGLPGQPLAAVSPALEQLAGQPAADLLGNSSLQLQQALHLEPQAADELAAVRAAGAAALVELSASNKSGKKTNFAVCLVPVASSSGAVLLQLEFWLDLDGQRADAERTGLKKLAAQVCRAAEAAVISTCQQGTSSITACSCGAQSLTGYSQPDLAGCSVLCLAGPETSNSSMRHLMAAQLAGQHALMKMLLYQRDGSAFWAMVASCPLAACKQASATVPHSAAAVRVVQQQQQHPGSSSGSGEAANISSTGSGGSSATSQLLLLLDITSSHARRVGKYALGRVLGAGASGVVHIGKHTKTGELVAVKAVDATRFHSISEIEQVQEEMAVLAQLRHPNIIRLQEVVFAGGCFYFMMEYASGGSLAGHLAAQPGGRLGEAAAREVFGGILAALEYCHKRRVIHRDLKPENILMQDGTPKIADFGLAGVIAPFNGSGFKLQCGTPEFTAPEIVGGAEYDGTAVDLWSVGVMLYEALCGQLPFHGANQQALFRSIRRGAYAPLPKTISADARDLVKRLLTVDPAARIAWDQLSRHPWLCRQAAQQQHRTSSCIGTGRSSDGAACCGTGTGLSSIDGASNAAGATPGTDVCETGQWPDSRVSADGSTAGTAPSGDGSCEGSDSGACASLQPSADRAHAADSGCYSQLPQRSAVSFTSASCHNSVRVVIADSSRDDPIAAAIKRIAGSSGFNSPQPSPGPQTEELKHTTQERTVSNATIKAGSSIVAIGARGVSSPSLASPSRAGRSQRAFDS